jgi:hypothetical protein
MDTIARRIRLIPGVLAGTAKDIPAVSIVRIRLERWIQEISGTVAAAVRVNIEASSAIHRRRASEKS